MNTKTASHVLVAGDDTRIFLSVARALGRAGKTVHAFPFSPNAPALASRYIAKVHAAPAHGSDAAAWRQALLALLKAERFDLVIPCEDAAIAALDQYRDMVPHQRLAIPAQANMAAFFDKEETHRLCAELGIPAAPSARLQSSDTSGSLIARFGLPLVLKPRRSFWADKGKAREEVIIVEDRAGVEQALAAISDRPRYLAEGYFEGSGTGVSVLCDNGTVLQAFQHRRLREGCGGCSSFRISEAVHPGLRQAVERVCRKTAHTGVCMFEFRVNPHTGAWILLEINARFWGSMQLPLALGLDYPNRLHDLLVNGTAAPEQAYPVGVRSRNLLLDANNLRKRLLRQGLAGLPGWLGDAGDFAVQPFRWITGRETPDTLAIDDMGPALREIRSLFRRKPGQTPETGLTVRAGAEHQPMRRAEPGRGVTTRIFGWGPNVCAAHEPRSQQRSGEP